MKIKIRRKWLIPIILILIGGTAFAGGMTVTGQVKKHDGTGADANYAVECWDGSIAPSPSAPYATGGTFSPSPPNTVTTASDGTLTNGQTAGFYDPRSNVSVTVKAWEGAAGSLWYGYGSYSIGDVNAPPGYAVVNITADFKAAAPDSPTVTAGGYNLTWDDASQKYLPAFTLTVHAGTAYKSEGVSYAIEVKKVSDSWTAAKKGSGSSWTIVEKDLANPYFAVGGTYEARATASNVFGSTQGQPKTFTIPGGGGAAAATANQVTIALRRKSGGLGINSFALPFGTVYDAAGTQINSLAGLAASLNAALGGAGYVATIGYWDEANQLEVGYTFDSKGAVLDRINTAQPDLPLPAVGKGLQISVTGDVTVTFRDYK
ncbi:MAG: hypothetical protein JW873_06185 [Candidatus Saganbacteria bacterium]|nr:hypothetical protein [Candidatus Saganbacteria bacterium]